MPAPGSSSSSISGSVIRARAINARLRSPSEREPKVRSARVSTPHSASSSVARSSSMTSYSSFQRPDTAYAAVTTTSETFSLAGIWVAEAPEDRPMRGRRSNTSTAPRVSSRISTSPLVGCRRAAAIESRVDLPAPLGPRTTQRSPSFTVQETSLRILRPPRITETF